MSTTAAVPLLLLGVLTALGTAETLLVAPLLPRTMVPACCRRRVDSFAARARLTLVSAVAAAVAGLVLLLT